MAYLVLKKAGYNIAGEAVGRRCVVSNGECCPGPPVPICNGQWQIPGTIYATVSGVQTQCDFINLGTTDPSSCGFFWANGLENRSYQLEYAPPGSPLYETPGIGLENCGQWYLTDTELIDQSADDTFFFRGMLVDSRTESCNNILGQQVNYRVTRYVNMRAFICCSCNYPNPSIVNPGVIWEWRTTLKLTSVDFPSIPPTYVYSFINVTPGGCVNPSGTSLASCAETDPFAVSLGGLSPLEVDITG